MNVSSWYPSGWYLCGYMAFGLRLGPFYLGNCPIIIVSTIVVFIDNTVLISLLKIIFSLFFLLLSTVDPQCNNPVLVLCLLQVKKNLIALEINQLGYLLAVVTRNEVPKKAYCIICKLYCIVNNYYCLSFLK